MRPFTKSSPFCSSLSSPHELPFLVIPLHHTFYPSPAPSPHRSPSLHAMHTAAFEPSLAILSSRACHVLLVLLRDSSLSTWQAVAHGGAALHAAATAASMRLRAADLVLGFEEARDWLEGCAVFGMKGLPGLMALAGELAEGDAAAAVSTIAAAVAAAGDNGGGARGGVGRGGSGGGGGGEGGAEGGGSGGGGEEEEKGREGMASSTLLPPLVQLTGAVRLLALLSRHTDMAVDMFNEGVIHLLLSLLSLANSAFSIPAPQQAAAAGASVHAAWLRAPGLHMDLLQVHAQTRRLLLPALLLLRTILARLQATVSEFRSTKLLHALLDLYLLFSTRPAFHMAITDWSCQSEAIELQAIRQALTSCLAFWLASQWRPALLPLLFSRSLHSLRTPSPSAASSAAPASTGPAVSAAAATPAAAGAGGGAGAAATPGAGVLGCAAAAAAVVATGVAGEGRQQYAAVGPVSPLEPARLPGLLSLLADLLQQPPPFLHSRQPPSPSPSTPPPTTNPTTSHPPSALSAPSTPSLPTLQSSPSPSASSSTPSWTSQAMMGWPQKQQVVGVVAVGSVLGMGPHMEELMWFTVDAGLRGRVKRSMAPHMPALCRIVYHFSTTVRASLLLPRALCVRVPCAWCDAPIPRISYLSFNPFCLHLLLHVSHVQIQLSCSLPFPLPPPFLSLQASWVVRTSLSSLILVLADSLPLTTTTTTTLSSQPPTTTTTTTLLTTSTPGTSSVASSSSSSYPAPPPPSQPASSQNLAGDGKSGEEPGEKAIAAVVERACECMEAWLAVSDGSMAARVAARASAAAAAAPAAAAAAAAGGAAGESGAAGDGGGDKGAKDSGEVEGGGAGLKDGDGAGAGRGREGGEMGGGGGGLKSGASAAAGASAPGSTTHPNAPLSSTPKVTPDAAAAPAAAVGAGGMGAAAATTAGASGGTGTTAIGLIGAAEAAVSAATAAAATAVGRGAGAATGGEGAKAGAAAGQAGIPAAAALGEKAPGTTGAGGGMAVGGGVSAAGSGVPGLADLSGKSRGDCERPVASPLLLADLVSLLHLLAQLIVHPSVQVRAPRLGSLAFIHAFL
ncbi:unnamed protein product [Closterium sp. NIES-54]